MREIWIVKSARGYELCWRWRADYIIHRHTYATLESAVANAWCVCADAKRVRANACFAGVK